MFHSNAQNTYGGFGLKAITKQCGGVYGGAGEITGGIAMSPNYPSRYSSNDYCMWLFVWVY